MEIPSLFTYFATELRTLGAGTQPLYGKNNSISSYHECAKGHENVHTKIYKITEMDADHVTAWSNGGSTGIENCQMLCKTHNRMKGNR